MGISRRRFLGWEPTTYQVLEDDGSVASRPETEWDTEQRGLMLALEVVRKGDCPGCGHPLAETTDPANEGRYRVPPPTRCHSCTALAVKHTEYAEVKYAQALRFGAHLPS